MYNDKEEYDGFPLIPVIFNIVLKSYEIMKVIKRGKNIKYKESKNHHNIFDGAGKELFGDNFAIVENSVYGPPPQEVIKSLNSFVDSPVENPLGQAWIQGELEKKKQN